MSHILCMVGRYTSHPTETWKPTAPSASRPWSSCFGRGNRHNPWDCICWQICLSTVWCLSQWAPFCHFPNHLIWNVQQFLFSFHFTAFYSFLWVHFVPTDWYIHANEGLRIALHHPPTLCPVVATWTQVSKGMSQARECANLLGYFIGPSIPRLGKSLLCNRYGKGKPLKPEISASAKSRSEISSNHGHSLKQK